MRRNAFAIIITLIIMGAATEACAGARGKRNVSPNGEFSFQVESHGRVLPIYNHNGKSYVEGAYGQTYGIRVNNHTGRHIEAVVTVDGRDVVSGKVGSYRTERGYVIDPYDSVFIEGFRRSWNNVAAFTFTSVGDSYAARMGDASNVGVIGVAVFKAKTYRPKTVPVYPYMYDDEAKEEAAPGLGTGYGRRSPKRSKSVPSAPAYSEKEAVDRDHNQGLGTGYGTDTYSPSTRTTFTRASRRPSAVMAVRYDDREGLYRLGVLPRPSYYRRAPTPEPFPNSPEPASFAPPPPSYWWE